MGRPRQAGVVVPWVKKRDRETMISISKDLMGKNAKIGGSAVKE